VSDEQRVGKVHTLSKPGGKAVKQVALLQAGRAGKHLASKAAAAVQEALAKLFEACFPDEPGQAAPCERWKDAGFQGEDPANDFRGGGIYSLLNLLYMAQNHEETFQRLLTKADGERSEWEYPFSAAGAVAPAHVSLWCPAARALRTLPVHQHCGLCLQSAAHRAAGQVQSCALWHRVECRSSDVLCYTCVC
jgi:ELMO/CED-12 family